MIRIRVMTAVALCVAAWSGSVFSGDAARAPIPDALRGYVSFSSVNQALKDADTVIVGATRGQKVNYVPGFLPMMFQMMNPLPVGSWDPDGPAFVLLLDTGGREFDGSRDGAFLVSAPDFNATIAGLELAGMEVEKIADGRWLWSLPKQKRRLILADAGEGQILATASEEIADLYLEILAAWRPVHDDRGSMGLAMRMAPILAGEAGKNFDNAAKQIASVDLDELAAKLEKDPEVSPECKTMVLGAARVLKKYYPEFDKGIRDIREQGISIRVDDDGIGQSYYFVPEKGVRLAGMAAHLAAQGRPEVALAARAGGDASALMICAGPDAMMPDAWRVGRDVLAVLVGEMFPGEVEAAGKVFDAIEAAGVGETVLAARVRENDFSVVTSIASPRPAALLAAAARGLEGVGRVMKPVLADAKVAIDLETTREAEDGSRYRAALSADRGASLGDSSDAKIDKLIADIGSLPDVLLSATGDGVELRTDRPAAEKPAEGAVVFSEDEMTRLAGRIGYRQAGMLLLDMDVILPLVAEQMAAGGKLSAKDARLFDESLKKSGAGTAIVGFGAESDRLGVELYISHKLVNQLYVLGSSMQKGGKKGR